MKKNIFLLALLTGIWAAPVVPSDPYVIENDNELTSIYSPEYAAFMGNIRSYQKKILSLYRDDFGYTLDDKLYAGFASSHNQIANGFSTQMPFNAQMNYIAGAHTLDYFSSASWLKMLMIHETAHNYQLNPKENSLSKFTHKIVGNTPLTMLGIFPIFPLPNYFMGSFILEGNAVLNESRFGLGGRLFSGYAMAQNVLLAKAGKLVPEFVFNRRLEYPYGEQWYLVGGHFQAFLAKRYGLQKVNHFFKIYSKQWLPFFLNKTFESYYGKSFEYLLSAFKQEILQQHQAFQKTKAKVLAHSQFRVALNASEDTIYTLITTAKAAPKILEISKVEGNSTCLLEQSTLPLGELFKYKGKYVSQSTRKTSPTRITKGLYTADARLLKETDSKVIQGYMPDGKMVYIDVKRSLEYPHIYIDGVFYDTAHSRVLVDSQGNLYYFKQQGEQRILYKNKKPLLRIPGHYGYVTDVDKQGNIYFIANSEHGTTLYKAAHQKLMRVAKGDDIVDMKLLANHQMFICTVTDDGFNYSIDTLIQAPAKIAKYMYAFENKSDKQVFPKQDFRQTSHKKPKAYSPLASLRYSALDQSMLWDENGFLGMFNAHFSDPLMQNSMQLFGATESSHSLAGVSYINSAYTMQFGASALAVFDQNESLYRSYGYAAYLQYPWLESGYWYGDIKSSYTVPYDTRYKKIWHHSLSIEKRQQFGFSKYPNALHGLQLFIAEDRGNSYYGGSYTFMHDLIGQSYLSLKGTYIKSKKSDLKTEQGIEIKSHALPFATDGIEMEMYSIDHNIFAKEVSVGEVGLYKVFDASAYFFSFPLSIQREAVYVKHKYYDIKTNQKQLKYNETTLGLDIDLLVYHSVTLPLQLEWIHNKEVENQDSFRVQLGVHF